MDKAKSQKLFAFQGDNSEKKEEYITELGESVHNYIRTGVKNSQLDELVKKEEEFHKKFEERFELDSILDAIKKSSQEKIKESKYLGQAKEDGAYSDWQRPEQLSPNAENVVQATMESVMDSMVEIMESKLEKALLNASYLSHVNMLYELYEREEKLRREEKEFERISEQYQKMADITKMLSEKRRMELKELESKTELSEQELGHVVSRCEGYFNISWKKGKCLISLSTSGKRYKEYVEKRGQCYDKAAWDQLTYKNCNNIIEGFRKSYYSGMRHELQLDGISSEYKRVVKHNYLEALRDILEADEVVYDIDDDSDMMRRDGKIHGKYKIGDSDGWDG